MSILHTIKASNKARAEQRANTTLHTINPLKRKVFAHTTPAGELAKEFICPPFSILDARQGWWTERKRLWWTIGTASSVTSVESSAYNIDVMETTTSAFDPVLAELMFRWFCPYKGSILDPFAGEQTNGIVASYLGYRYVGIEIRKDRVLENRQAALDLALKPRWLVGDSSNLNDFLPKKSGTAYPFDFVFTSPPYFNLETYSEESGDGSTYEKYKDFRRWYLNIFAQCYSSLARNRFLAVKVGEVRTIAGQYIGLVSDTIQLFQSLGLHYYNEFILITPAGTLPQRTGAQFRNSRKAGKTHQNILVFYKGDLSAIPETFKPIRRNA